MRARRLPSGEVAETHLVEDGGALALVDDAGVARALPVEALFAVFRRYGKPLSEPLPPHALDDQLVRVARASLRAFEVMGFGEVLPADYLLWEVDGEEPLAAPAPLIAEALGALARAVAHGA